jgi:hypothetical protein
MKKTNKTILLMAVAAILMIIAASCGAAEEDMYSAKDFLFIKVDVDSTWISFALLCMLLAGYWFCRFHIMKELKEEDPSITYWEAEDYIMDIASSNLYEEREGKGDIETFIWGSLRIGPFLCRVTPVMMVYSWFFDRWHLPYWIFTVLTCLALRFVPKWLGLDLSRFYSKWIVIWSIFSFVVLVTALIVNKGGA